MKALKNLFYWVVLPGVFAGSIFFHDQNLALVGATLLWVVALTLGPSALILLLALMQIKPENEKWSTNRERILKLKSGSLKRFLSWTSLLITAVLCAYTGFVISAVFYTLATLWCKFVVTVLVTHYENPEMH